MIAEITNGDVIDFGLILLGLMVAVGFVAFVVWMVVRVTSKID